MSESLSELMPDGVPEPVSAIPAKRKLDLEISYKGDDSALDNRVFHGEVGDLSRPWMKLHSFKLVRTAAEVHELVERALRVGRVALDLETEGLDNRIEYRDDGSFYTRHRIVGYCLCIERDGFYIPVRHYQDPKDPNPNVDSVESVEEEIKRLCWAAQPVLKDGSIDMLGAKAKDFEVPPRVVIEFWHAKFDQEFLYPITGIDIWNPASFEDGMLMVYALCTEDEQGLKENARDRLEPLVDPETGAQCPYDMITFKKLFPKTKSKAERRFQELTPSEYGDGWNVVLYGCSDAICTRLLCAKMLPEVQAIRQHGFYVIEKQVAQVVRVIERTRVLINKGEISSLLAEADAELAECEARIKALAVSLGFPSDFNPGSAAQLADFLFGPKGVWNGEKPEKTAEGQYKTDEKTIEQLGKSKNAPEVFGLIIKHRQIGKVRGTYLQSLVKNTDELNQLRLNFKPTGAATGRFTAPNGNPAHGYAGVPIQGIPARDDPKKPRVAHSLRRAFIARPGYVIVKADYASQELRIAASVSGEQKWIAEYEKEATTGVPADLHFMTAQAFYPGLTKDSPDLKLKRNSGKTANFALIYGGGVGAVQRATGCDKVEGARLKKAFDDSVPGFSRWVKGQHKLVKERGGIYTAFQRFVRIPSANIEAKAIRRQWLKEKKRLHKDGTPRFSEAEVGNEVKKRRAGAERMATNYPIQGTGADVLKISLILLHREFHLRRWLKNGGDDSVRLIMTVHDEVVFEIREDRVAEAVPILIRIMESPTRMLKNWRVPLVVEADIGSAWAAKTSWSAVVRGEVAPPPYLAGKTLATHPDVIVLSKMAVERSTAAPVAKAPPVAAPSLIPVSAVPASVATAAPPLAPADAAPTEPAVPAEPAKHESKTSRIASMRLKSSYLDREAVRQIVHACVIARTHAFLHEEEQIPVEFLLGGERHVVLFDAKEGFLVPAPRLACDLRRMNLLDELVIREVHG